eukprot:754700-Hanusia_phi.AAC.6
MSAAKERGRLITNLQTLNSKLARPPVPPPSHLLGKTPVMKCTPTRSPTSFFTPLNTTLTLPIFVGSNPRVLRNVSYSTQWAIQGVVVELQSSQYGWGRVVKRFDVVPWGGYKVGGHRNAWWWGGIGGVG